MAKKHYKIIHVMTDGTELEDITDYVIPAGHQVYNILKAINEKQLEASWCNISFKTLTSSYTAVSNEFIQDKDLSNKAKGLLLVILSNKDEWRVYPTELVKRSKDGLVSVRNTLEELENAGYVRTYKKSLGRGQGVEYFRFCADRKISDEIFESLKTNLNQTLQN